MTPCKFTFDDGPQWDGFAYGSTWNGFDNVAVTADERAKIAYWMAESSMTDAVFEEIDDLMSIPPIKPAGMAHEVYSLGWGYATQIVRDRALPEMPDDAARIIAAHFVAVLRAWLKPYEWRRMRERNARERNPLICHSHDFCDANMAMAEAFESVTGRTPDVDDEAISKLWNEAWEIAMPSLGRNT